MRAFGSIKRTGQCMSTVLLFMFDFLPLFLPLFVPLWPLSTIYPIWAYKKTNGLIMPFFNTAFCLIFLKKTYLPLFESLLLRQKNSTPRGCCFFGCSARFRYIKTCHCGQSLRAPPAAEPASRVWRRGRKTRGKVRSTRCVFRAPQEGILRCDVAI